MWHSPASKMRDRRNTNLSISSTTSTSSSGSAPSAPSRSSLNEKRSSSPPLPSSPLPAPVTKENRPRNSARRKFWTRTASLTALLFILLRLGFHCWPVVWRDRYPTEQILSDHVTVDGDVVLPSTPTALIVADTRGISRWTISIPQNSTFPLQWDLYEDMCKHADFLRDSLASHARTSQSRFFQRKKHLFAVDETFLDVVDAEKAGALPKTNIDEATAAPICDSSLTFVLGADDSSFGKSLLLVWLSYGLATLEGRTFFLDDSQWAWGRFDTFFKPMRAPKCSPPPSHWILPCPYNAKHLLVSTATASRTFGDEFHDVFSNNRKLGVAKQSRIFDLVRVGYHELFRLNDEDSAYAETRISELKDAADRYHGRVVGIHIRRGDLRPFEFQYSKDYLPLERYAEMAQNLLRAQLKARGSRDDLTASKQYVQSQLVLASDDPDIINANGLEQATYPLTVQRAQEKIRLATKAALDQASPVAPLREPGSAYVKHVEENAGWEGGFYNALFFSMGGGGQVKGAQPDLTIPPETLLMRGLVGRAYLLDLTVLGHADGIVCAVSSATCRVLAVMMGWDAVTKDRWVNVDDGRAWSWDGRGR